MTFQFAVLGSGSKGNSALFRQQGAGLLIDAGLGVRLLAERLASVGSDWSHLSAVVLTHTHGDHVDTGVFRGMARRGIPLYCHEGHHQNLDRDEGFKALDRLGLVRCYDDRPFMAPSGFRVEPVTAWHDGGPTFGFRLEAGAGRKRRGVAVGYLTDTGTWCDATADALVDVDVLGVEFNHDVMMQRTSGRHPALIARNLGDRGHLSNRQAADLVSSILARSRRDRVSHLVLLHLSDQCNRPEIALREAGEAVRESGRQVLIHAARQAPAHPDLSFGPTRSAAYWKPHGAASRTARPSSARRRPSDACGFLPGLNLESS
ncbi:MBL fold metallo-hydrolase [Paludisphaera mucosa]|uniref:MBL fold metallo-hydrolase n=1 Tax=Paludisphaera mucosa TaxID=3030827 RepID=A0ABT6F8X3_9BACT|nr:MBL fold metallo-hydrolase [Paludisphaera mucosa]MDG3003838.1 MBL fold metallo-hydrolase [Paludisphaera mucosa]